MNIEDTRSNFSQNTSAILPDITQHPKYKRGGIILPSPYKDYMFENNRTQMLWKAVGVMAAGEPGRTNSNLLDQQNRIKYNEFDYVKRISLQDFKIQMNPAIKSDKKEKKIK